MSRQAMSAAAPAAGDGRGGLHETPQPIKAPRVMGIDPALNSTGVVYPGPDGAPVIQLYRPPKESADGMARIAWMRRWLSSLLRIVKPDVVAIEGYSFGSKGQAVFNIGEFGGVMRFTIWEAGAAIVEVPPATLKVYATGSGNAEKDAMIAEAIRRLGYAGSNRDEADAAWLFAMAMDAYGAPIAELPQTHRRAVTQKPELWPTITREGGSC
jgi:Holliday junction resolvasome RuvABC endonuclease subunit